jgi:putative membrane protein
LSETDAWRRTSPLAVLFFFGRLLRGILRNAAQSIAPVAAFVVAWEGSTTSKLAIALSAIAIFSVVYSILRYLFFRFRIDTDSVLIRDGIFNKKQLDIRFDRIQGVNTEQSFIYRWFDLVDIRFDTAGSKGSEGNLPAVRREFADDLRRRIARQTPAVDVDAGTDAETAPMLRLTNGDMVRIGLSDRRALVLLAVLGPAMEQAGDRVEAVIADTFESAFDSLQSLGLAAGGAVLISIVLTVLAVMALISVGAAFWRYHNFELRFDGETLQSTGGLTTRHQVSTNTSKVQRIRLSQGMLLRWFGRFRFTAYQASSSEQDQSSFKVPLLEFELGECLSRELFAPEARELALDPDDPGYSRVHPRYAVTLTLFVGVLPALLAGTVLWIVAGPLAALALAWPILVYLVVRRVWKQLGWKVTEDAIVRRSGFIGVSVNACLVRKVQRVTVSQSWFQKRRGLASISFSLANGSIDLPYIPIDDARAIQDFVLYRIESSNRSWH